MKKIKLILNTMACLVIFAISSTSISAQSSASNLKNENSENRSAIMKAEVKVFQAEIDAIKMDKSMSENQKRVLIDERREVFHKNMKSKHSKSHPYKTKRAKAKKLNSENRRSGKVANRNIDGQNSSKNGRQSQIRKNDGNRRNFERAALSPAEKVKAVKRLDGKGTPFEEYEEIRKNNE